MITEKIREALLDEIIENSTSAHNALMNGDEKFADRMKTNNHGILRAIEILDEIVREEPKYEIVNYLN